MEFVDQIPYVEVGLRQDEDELLFKKLSVYATIREADLRRDSLSDIQRRSIKDVLSNWGPIEQLDDVEHNVIDVKKPEQLELRDHELRVKGFDVDSRVAPGYRYCVRYLGTEEYLFDGEAKRLESIGLGYGRRLTFQGETLNNNENYFWSDSAPEGYGFTIEAVREGDRFTITDAESEPVGFAEIERVRFPQEEKDTHIEDKNVVKDVRVRFACSLENIHHDYNVVNINLQKDIEIVEGIAEVIKEKGSKEAVVRKIRNVHFQRFGTCQLLREL